MFGLMVIVAPFAFAGGFGLLAARALAKRRTLGRTLAAAWTAVTLLVALAEGNVSGTWGAFAATLGPFPGVYNLARWELYPPFLVALGALASAALLLLVLLAEALTRLSHPRS